MSPRKAISVRLKWLEHGEGLAVPAKATSHSAGFDLRAAIEAPLVLAPQGRTAVPTGLAMEIPAGWEGQVRPRSGLALRFGVTVANAPGTIDADYRGEVKVLLIHHGLEPFTIERGDRIAQVVFARVPEVELEWAETLEASDRGQGGFGSTGQS